MAILTEDELEELESCIQKAEAEGYDETLAYQALNKIKKQIDHEAELWKINEELVKAGYEPWHYESFAQCVADLRENGRKK